jgi:hypothetical protein
VLLGGPMNIQSSKRHSTITFLCFATLSVTAFGVAFEPGQHADAASGVIAETNQARPLVSRTENDAYVAEIKPAGTYAVGKEGLVDIVVTSKEPFHINEAYSYKFRTPDPAPENVTYPKPFLTRADGKFDTKTGAFRLPFVVSKAGKHKIGGTLSLSVCSQSSCLMEKVELELEVEAK